MKGSSPKIYLVGPYHGFRDKIIEALPEFDFADPRNHRQSSMAKLVCDDLGEAQDCPISLAVFPEGKARGVMSYVELGVAYSYGNHIITVNQGDEEPVLEKISERYYDKLGHALDYIKGDASFKARRKEIESKYNNHDDTPLPVNNILICGNLDDKVLQIIEDAQKKSAEKNFFINTDSYRSLEDISLYDLLVAYFPKESGWKNEACLLMGGAYAHDISILLVDEHEWKYPPLQAVARRHCGTANMFEYITEVDDLRINVEARKMYDFFERERKRSLDYRNWNNVMRSLADVQDEKQ